MDAIDEKYLTEEQRILLYDYQKQVYDKVSPYLTEEEAQWLRRETRVDSTILLKNQKV